ncbi:MAG: zinc-ribbon domain-containing protein [Deltaproteobacteria bacterium]|nr:zinc-ribbon domain-containing protein [Deltaproteobacteria bacterium]MBN2673188.1 zinc-ribbon domain-containing protein [Deltaproteobacteria bacterium]
MNINCPGCNFEYKLDERRIPPSGQKMRCPKCSASFRISKDGTLSESTTSLSPSPFKGTLTSMPPVLNDAPSRPSGVQNTELDDPFGDNRQSATEADDIWSNPFDAPSSGPIANDPFASTSSPFADPFAGEDLPAPKDDPFAGEDLPTPLGHSDLPAPRGDVDLPTPAGFSDLPTPLDDSDLPIPLGDSDLPTPLGNSDLPMPVGNSDFPIPVSDAPIPQAAAPRDSMDTDPFGDIGISMGDDPFDVSPNSAPSDFGAVSTPPSKIDTGDFDLPPARDSSFDDSDDAMDPFGGTPLPSPADAAAKTLMGAGSFAQTPPNDPLGDDDFDIPSPADIAGIPPSASPAGHTIPMNRPDAADEFGNIDLQTSNMPSAHPSTSATRTSGVGSTDFGQIDFGGGQSEDSGEFDAFPVQEEDDDDNDARTGGSVSDTIDLADAPIRAEITEASFGGLPGDSPANDEKATTAGKKIAGSFEGRRRYERQSRKSKIIIMLLLLIIGAGGGALHFTPYGVFGVNYLITLLPSATADEVVAGAFTSAMNAVDKDTYKSLNTAIDELNSPLKELPQNDDIRLIGVYLHSWHQLRFGISSEHEKAALKLLGNINLDQSESKYASIVKAARNLLSDKPKAVVNSLAAKPKLSSNEAALLTMAYLKSNEPQKAAESVKKAVGKRSTPRFQYLKSLALTQGNQLEEAKSVLQNLLKQDTNHNDARLLFAKLLVMAKEKDSQKVTALLTPINEASELNASNVQKAMVHSIVGQMLLQRRKYDDAKKEFFKAKSLNPKDPLMLTGNGNLSLMKGDLPGAITQFKAALVESPNHLEAEIGVAATLIRQDKTQEAQDILMPILQSHPEIATVHYLLGTIAQSIKQFDKALASYQKAIELDAEYIEAYVSMATVYMETENTKKAMKTLDTASAAVPGSALIKLTLADGHAANEDYTSAVVSLNEALEIEPENPIIHFKMAQMYRKMEELQDAQNALDEVARLEPTFPGLSVEQGYLMELSGKIDDALKTYEEALKRNPDDISAKTRVAAASIYQHNYDRAKELLVEVLNENPDSADGNFYMGEIFRAELSGADAVPYLKNATELDPNNPLYFVRYGASLAMIHDVGKAMKQYKKAMELDPKMAETYLRVGELKLRSGSVKDAIEQCEKALELNPEIQRAYLLIGEAYEELADLKSAAAYYQKSTQAFPRAPEGFFKLGQTYLQTKGNKGAIGPLRNAVRLAESAEVKPYWLPAAYYHLGSAQKATGERSGAVASFKRYLEIAPEDAIDRSEVQASLDDLLY